MIEIEILKISFVLIGTIIGAGFASGKEIYLFFNIYGKQGLIGLFISIFLIVLIILKTFYLRSKYNVNTYQAFTKILTRNNKVFNKILNNLINLFLLLSYIVMCAGFGAFFKQRFGWPAYYGAVIISTFAYLIFRKDIDGIVKINFYLIPILILSIYFLGIRHIGQVNLNFYSFKSNKWMIDSVIYASYNSIILIPIILNCKKIKFKRTIIITLVVAIIMITMAYSIFKVLMLNPVEAREQEIPIVSIGSKFGKSYEHIYSFTILVAIFTTAISSGYSFLRGVAENRKQYKTLAIVISITAIVSSNVGFAALLSYLYPVLGYLGLLQIFFILIT